MNLLEAKPCVEALKTESVDRSPFYIVSVCDCRSFRVKMDHKVRDLCLVELFSTHARIQILPVKRPYNSYSISEELYLRIIDSL